MGTAIRLGAAHRRPGAGDPRGCALARAGRGGSGHRVKLRLPRILADEDELDREQPPAPPRVEEAAHIFPSAPPWSWLASVAAVALIPRLGYLFFVADPENAGDGFTDAYHHWQIAYLTIEIALAPAAVFNDTAGMPEPVAVALALFGIWLTPRRGFWAGVAWGLAAMARVEAWLFGAGLVIAYVLGRRSRALWLVAGWLLTMGLYMRFMWDQTGNPIYPFYWSFLFVGFGAFNSAPLVPTAHHSLRPL